MDSINESVEKLSNEFNYKITHFEVEASATSRHPFCLVEKSIFPPSFICDQGIS